MCREDLSKCIIESLEADPYVSYEEPEVTEGFITIDFYVGGIITASRNINFEGRIVAFDNGYYIMSFLGTTAAKKAIPKLIRFTELLNTYLSSGDINVDAENERVFFRTYERFWNEHAFDEETFIELLHAHIDANIDYKDSIYLLIKGASGADSQIKKLKKRDVI